MSFHIDQDSMRKLIKGCLQSVLEDTNTSMNVCELVWEKLFGTFVLDDKEDEEALLLFDDIYEEYIRKMIKTLTKGVAQMGEGKEMEHDELCADAQKGKIDRGPEPCVGSDSFKEDCFALRARIEETKQQTKMVIEHHPTFDPRAPRGVYQSGLPTGREERVHIQPSLTTAQTSEMKANLKLAFRHLEDARMRLGKAIQAYDGGESCYPR